MSGEQYAGAIATVHDARPAVRQGLADVDVFLVPTLLTDGPPPLAHLNQPRGSTQAFFRVEFQATGWTPMANVSGFRRSRCRSRRGRGLPMGSS